MAVIEPTNLGLGEAAHLKLRRLEEEGHFAQMVDAYRFAIALALAFGTIPDDIEGSRQNVFGVATVDPDKEIYTAIRLLIDTGDLPVYRWAERLADWGVTELFQLSQAGKLEVCSIIKSVTEAN